MFRNYCLKLFKTKNILNNNKIIQRTLFNNNNNEFIEQNMTKPSPPRVLITGSFGQLGFGLANLLRKKYGRNNIIMSDIIKPSSNIIESGPYVFIDILNTVNIEKIIIENNIDWIIHFSALLSSIGEQNLKRAIDVNINGLHNIFDVCLKHKLSLFIPSTIGAFGPETPRDIPTPDYCIQRPKTIYGVSKVHAELLGEYYHHKYKLNFRSLRLPGIISADTQPGGGTTDYAVDIFHHAYDYGEYDCYLQSTTRLPMMYIDDCLRSILELMETPEHQLKQRTYNIYAMDFTPIELSMAIKRYIPEFQIKFTKIDHRQTIAETWPQSLNDDAARRDWNWKHEYDLDKLCRIMFQKISETRKSKFFNNNNETITTIINNEAIIEQQQHTNRSTTTSIHHQQQQQQMAY